MGFCASGATSTWDIARYILQTIEMGLFYCLGGTILEFYHHVFLFLCSTTQHTFPTSSSSPPGLQLPSPLTPPPPGSYSLQYEASLHFEEHSQTTPCWLYRSSSSCLLAQSSNPTRSQLTPPSSSVLQTTISTLPSFRLPEPSSAQ